MFLEGAMLSSCRFARCQIGPRVEKEFSRVLSVVVTGSLLVVIICASIGQCAFSVFARATRFRTTIWLT